MADSGRQSGSGRQQHQAGVNETILDRCAGDQTQVEQIREELKEAQETQEVQDYKIKQETLNMNE